MEYYELYVHRIRSLCQQRGWSINRLAAMSGVKQSTLDNIVRGETRNPRVRTLHLVANAFGMTLSEFLDFEELNAYAFDE
ncbi:MAG TPA: helix-turn-helix transcriptional regulator [Candidatus Scatomorpha intestinavium]|uniref:Helix-turn-helix transcriptional regulator n=1 Tax=Candidatus Scatomorpha intestinavium TaxID=2840922 RepID=A0A9D0ZDT4_9FIRM|nr:helix-turn-helix transcriptional regulator [Candidatus Scatomorpha intestinavium]